MMTYDLINSVNRPINAIEVTPYVLYLSPNTIDFPDAEKFKEKYVGVCINTGRYFGAHHRVRTDYVNPHIKEQIAWVKKNNIPFGLLSYIDSLNLDEAKEEFRALYNLLLAYPPNLGLWLSIQSRTTAATIERIIDWYQRMLINRGFRYQIGFANTKKELDWFDWQKYCNNRAGVLVEYKDFNRTSVSNYFANDWNLWWLDMPNEEPDFDSGILRTPAFFKLIDADKVKTNLAPTIKRDMI